MLGLDNMIMSVEKVNPSKVRKDGKRQRPKTKTRRKID